MVRAGEAQSENSLEPYGDKSVVLRTSSSTTHCARGEVTLPTGVFIFGCL